MNTRIQAPEVLPDEDLDRSLRPRRLGDFVGQEAVKAAVCGHGAANKDQVATMVAQLLGLSDPPAPDHAADALAVAICHLHRAPLARAVAASERRGARA